MSKGFCFAAFLSGVIAGAAAGWQYAKRKYERIAQEEIDSVKKSIFKEGAKTRNRDKGAGVWRIVEKYRIFELFQRKRERRK